MKKVLVLGCGGMAGHMVSRYLGSLGKYKIINADIKKIRKEDIFFDASQFSHNKNFLLKAKPFAVINCIGVLVEESKKNPAKAALLNGLFPHHLEWVFRNSKTRIVHLSTDCVFSGKKGGYCEGDFKDGEDFYARSKSLGEIINGKDITLRTSIIGPEIKKTGSGLFHWFTHARGQVKGFSNVQWSGVTTLELAKIIDAILQKNIKGGLYHVAPDKKISKYELLRLIKKIWRLNVKIKKSSGYKCDKSLKPSKQLGIKIKDYKQML
ncbi:MAG: sugar nucleotide-binding protein, partial [Elusimicrobia bacterium]|nr:sugar nucleotide-binding protein [Elusimicrobiota bacterium]